MELVALSISWTVEICSWCLHGWWYLRFRRSWWTSRIFSLKSFRSLWPSEAPDFPELAQSFSTYSFNLAFRPFETYLQFSQALTGYCSAAKWNETELHNFHQVVGRRLCDHRIRFTSGSCLWFINAFAAGCSNLLPLEHILSRVVTGRCSGSTIRPSFLSNSKHLRLATAPFAIGSFSASQDSCSDLPVSPEAYSSSIPRSFRAQLFLYLWSPASLQNHFLVSIYFSEVIVFEGWAIVIAPIGLVTSTRSSIFATSPLLQSNSSFWYLGAAPLCLFGRVNARSTADWTHSWSCESHTYSAAGWNWRNYCAWSIWVAPNRKTYWPASRWMHCLPHSRRWCHRIGGHTRCHMFSPERKARWCWCWCHRSYLLQDERALDIIIIWIFTDPWPSPACELSLCLQFDSAAAWWVSWSRTRSPSPLGTRLHSLTPATVTSWPSCRWSPSSAWWLFISWCARTPSSIIFFIFINELY